MSIDKPHESPNGLNSAMLHEVIDLSLHMTWHGNHDTNSDLTIQPRNSGAQQTSISNEDWINEPKLVMQLCDLVDDQDNLIVSIRHLYKVVDIKRKRHQTNVHNAHQTIISISFIKPNRSYFQKSKKKERKHKLPILVNLDFLTLQLQTLCQKS